MPELINPVTPTGHSIIIHNRLLYFSFPSLYDTLVSVAGSQLEKLRAALVDIRQTRGTSLQDCGGETDKWEAAGLTNTPSEQFRHMQEQLYAPSPGDKVVRKERIT
jgi:hypothetical protein